ncbi:MAG: 5-bromo-4-chloroindolyl phosphate hydrolysis family protein [Lachnospiraceae bacterium]|nr:5-bromo-4-chloroindolyl phosphate hydrolysis family protein [Lachnospiraceae bacterium]
MDSGTKIHLASDGKVVYNQNIEKDGEERLGIRMEKREKTEDSNLGNEIQNIVQSAVSQGNFKNLNREISKTVNTAIQQVNMELGQVQGKQQSEKNDTRMMYRNGVYSTYEPENGKEKSSVSRNYNNVRRMQSAVPTKRYQSPLVTSRPAGSVSGMMATVFGWIGVLGFGVTESILAILMGTGIGGTGAEVAFGILLPFLLISIFLLSRGNTIRKRLNRYREYVKYLHGRTFCEIKELATAVDKDKNFVVKDLRKMMELKMFPQGRLSKKKDYLFLNAESYEQYMQAQSALEQRNRLEAEEQKRLKKEEEEQRQREEEDPYVKEMREAVTDGESYLKQIREANEAIIGEEISNQLYKLEDIIGRIFMELEKNPDKIGEMRKFMDYYLPTTIKLINAYREFDHYTVETDNIRNSKQEIENTIDTIIKAFYKLFDSLFDDKAMDIATDISVLNTMLAQEGLKESDFDRMKS